MENEVEKLFGDLEKDKPAEDILKEEIPTPEKEEEEESPKNRRDRRLEERYQRERESNIALSARIQVLTEADRFRQDIESKDDVPVDWLNIYGGTTPEGQEAAKRAWKLQQELLEQTSQKAEDRAYERIKAEQNSIVEEQKGYESEIDSRLEYLEEEYNVDLTGNNASATKARKEFLELVQALSPKDDEGNLTGYADFDSTFKIYQQSRKTDNSRQKELGSRSMQTSGKVNVSKENEIAEIKAIRAQGINI